MASGWAMMGEDAGAALVALALASAAWLVIGNITFHLLLAKAKRDGNLLFY